VASVGNPINEEVKVEDQVKSDEVVHSSNKEEIKVEDQANQVEVVHPTNVVSEE
jgi:DNA/RNA endonuclease YhcR with UshA esterase domain